MFTKIMNNLTNDFFIVFLMIFIFSFKNLSYAQTYTEYYVVYTPEGESFIAGSERPEFNSTEMASLDSVMYFDYIIPYGLNAVKIGNPSRSYNCHGYAWIVSEGGLEVNIGMPTNLFCDDQAYSNDRQPSYLSASESEATHAYYCDGSHSARKIQNSYPCAIEGGRNYVSKWGPAGLYAHAKGHDPYFLGEEWAMEFYKLKTTHSDTLSAYPKTWVGAGGRTHTVTGNLTVNSSLNIMPGATVNFQSGVSLTINGDLNADGSSGDITFNFTIPSSNNGIKCYSGSDVNIDHAIIENAFYGIYADNGSDVYIKNSELMNNTYGIYVYYYSDLKVTGNYIHNNTYGIQGAYGSTVKLYGNVIENNSSYGVIGFYGVIFQLGFPYNWSGYNTVRENGNYEIYSYNSNTDIDMYNASVHDDTGYEIVNSGSTSIYCLNSWFGSNGLSSSGTIVNVGQLGSQPAWEGVLDDDDSSVPKLGSSPDIPNKYRGYEGVLALKNIIKDNSKSVKEVSDALADLYTILRVDYKENKYHERSKFNDFLAEQISNSKDKSLRTQASKYQVSWNILEKNYYNAITLSEKLLENCSNEDSLEVLLSMAKLYSLIGEKGNVNMLSSEIKNKYGKKNQFVFDFLDVIENSDGYVENGNQFMDDEIKADQKDVSSLNEFNIVGNYPNPFNPSTTISYTLPEDGKVQVKIFDVLGREVATLMNGFDSKGKHSVVWDGSNSASGIYFCTITFKNQTINKKMLMIK